MQGTRPWGSLTCRAHPLQSGQLVGLRGEETLACGDDSVPRQGQMENASALGSQTSSCPWTRLLRGETVYSKFLVFWQELIIVLMLICASDAGLELVVFFRPTWGALHC